MESVELQPLFNNYHRKIAKKAVRLSVGQKGRCACKESSKNACSLQCFCLPLHPI